MRCDNRANALEPQERITRLDAKHTRRAQGRERGAGEERVHGRIRLGRKRKSKRCGGVQHDQGRINP